MLLTGAMFSPTLLPNLLSDATGLTLSRYLPSYQSTYRDRPQGKYWIAHYGVALCSVNIPNTAERIGILALSSLAQWQEMIVL
jgi:hypothetical protein